MGLPASSQHVASPSVPLSSKRSTKRMSFRLSTVGSFCFLVTLVSIQLSLFPEKPLIGSYQMAFSDSGLHVPGISVSPDESYAVGGTKSPNVTITTPAATIVAETTPTVVGTAKTTVAETAAPESTPSPAAPSPQGALDGDTDYAERSASLQSPGTVQRTLENLSNVSSAFREDGSEKPLLLVHIGPPKTATTTLQVGFKVNKRELLRGDNIHYCNEEICGHIAHGFGKCGVNPNFTEADECWDRVQSKLRSLPRPSTTTHVLLSAEPMSIGYKYQHRMDCRAPLDWLTLKETFGRDWKIVIIIGYRRYMDWLPSSEQQIWRWTPTKKNLQKWPVRERRRLLPLFPTRWKTVIEPGKYTYSYTNRLVESIQGILPVVLFNMHDLGDMFPTINITESSDLPTNDKVSLLSRFVCKTLPEAGVKTNATCAKSLLADKEKRKENRANPSQTLFYDALAIAAWDKNMIPKDSGRHIVGVKIEEFHKSVLNETFRDFPVVCPNEKENKMFLSYSLAQEAQVLPEFHSSSLGKQSHVEIFWDNVKHRKYCWIDSDSVLERKEWRDFFDGLSKRPLEISPMAERLQTRNRKKKAAQ